MKKKSKVLNKLITAMFAVLCVALLCVPAFASSTVIVSETTLTFDEDGMAVISASALLSLGYTYIVNWNGVEYTCVPQDCSQIYAGCVGLGNLELAGMGSNGEPFVIQSLPGDGTAVLSLDGSTSATISIYVVGSSNPSNLIYIQYPVTIPEGGVYEGHYTIELIKGETYIVSVNGVEHEVVCDVYSDLDLTAYRLTDNSSFVYFQSIDHPGNCMINATPGAEVAVYQLLPGVPLIQKIMSDAGSVVTSLTSWIGNVARMVINEPVLLIGFTIGLATLAFGVFKGLKR